jgi:hypothetical protein
MAEPWKTLKRVVLDALERVQPASQTEEALPPFAPDYDRVFASLTREELYGDSTILLDEDLFADLFEREHRDDHFLGFYSVEGANLAFERYGFYQLLRDQGFSPKLIADTKDPDEHRLRIYDAEPSPDRLLIELAVGFRELSLPDAADCRLLFINWLLMQNPREAFSPDRPPLPDQEHPGLGLFPHFGYLLRLMALRLECDGLLNHPSHFHNGVLYGRFFHFVDPVTEGRFRALEDLLGHLPLAEATDAVAQGQVVDDRGQTVAWKPEPHVAPITNRARRWFASEGYRATVESVRRTAGFELQTI